MKHSTEEYSELLEGRLPTSTLEFELCDRLIELQEQVKNCSIPDIVGQSEQFVCKRSGAWTFTYRESDGNPPKCKRCNGQTN